MALKLIVCNGMIRSGSTLLYNLVCHIAAQRYHICRLGYRENVDAREPVEAGTVYVVKANGMLPGIAQAVETGVAHVLYIHRDIRDVYAADKVYTRRLGHSHYGDNANGIIPYLLICLQTYMALRRVAHSEWRYEDLMANGLEWFISGIAESLGITLPADVTTQLAQEFNLTHTKAMTDMATAAAAETLWHPMHTAGARVGLYQSELSEVELGAMHLIFGFQLRLSGHLPQYTK